MSENAPAGGRRRMSLNVASPPYDYNSSDWGQRIPICVLASIAAVIATYMGLFQWGLIDSVWDPVFGDQSEKVLLSQTSETMRRWMLVPDAILGALAYLGDAVYGLAGSTRRWQMRPWMTILFGLDVVPLGIISAVLVVLQGTVVGYWCFLCLTTAAISLLLVYFAYDEVLACLRYLWFVWTETRDAKILWNVIWGRADEQAANDAERYLVEEAHVAANG